MKYTHITDSERRVIERGLESGKGVSTIARRLGRSKGSISEEIKRNSVNSTYSRKKANYKATWRRKRSKIQCMKVAMDKELKNYVIKHIKDEQSPEGISERLKYIDRKLTYASFKAIYKFVYSPHGRQIEKHLYSKRVRKKGGPKKTHLSKSDNRVYVDKRSKKANERKEFGHFEGDFIESGRDGRGSLLVLVERKTRYPFLAYTEDRRTKGINNLISSLLKDTPIKSITLDNDLSFQKHEALSELLNTLVFFTHPYTSQEKGSVENRNKKIREHIPKKD